MALGSYNQAMRYRLRTLLIVFAAAPALLSTFVILDLERVDASLQVKDRMTRRQLQEVRAEMYGWLRQPSQYNALSQLVVRMMTAKASAKCATGPASPGAPLDAWDRKLRIGMRGESVIFASSDGPNGVPEDGQGDDIEISLMVDRPQLWMLWHTAENE
jgi:hypothetical protein